MIGWVFEVLAHVLIVAGMGAIFWFIAHMVSAEKLTLERIILVASAMTGFLIYFGARVLGLSIPELMMSSITTTSSLMFVLQAILLPSAAGYLAAWYCIHVTRGAPDLARRLVALLGAFLLVMFSDVYAATYSAGQAGRTPGAKLLPNLTFVIAMSLHVIFKFRSREQHE